MAALWGEDSLLTNRTGKDVYAEVRDSPIFDYHCHLSPKDILEDRVFADLGELWLESDHYKWRVMRQAGVDERLVTGDAPMKDKFLAFAAALPRFFGNPVYHWAHLELRRYFGIDLPINAGTAGAIWERSSDAMRDGEYSAVALLRKAGVDCLITTDDPVDGLESHARIAARGEPFRVLPCFRPDRAIDIGKPGFVGYVGSLGRACGFAIDGWDSLVAALESRLERFVDSGCVSSDCSLEAFPEGDGDVAEAAAILRRKLGGEEPSRAEQASFRFALIERLLEAYARKDIAALIHVGVMRDCNGGLLRRRGPDSGADSVGDSIDIDAARRLLDRVDGATGLPKLTVFALSPGSYYPIATLLGDFRGPGPGALQLGAAWWFMDHRDGIAEQLRAFAATGGLGLFNGMLTDSRSFLSYARHDYFRRILCSLIGEWVEAGEMPDDPRHLADMARAICHGNAAGYFRRDR